MIQFNEFYLLQYFKRENNNKVIKMVIEEKIIHILGFLVNKQIYQYIYNFINHETSPLPSLATYPRDTIFQCFCIFIFPSLIQSSHYTSLKNSIDLQSTDASLQEPRGMLLCPSQPMLESFLLLFFFFLTNHLVPNLKFYI